MVVVGGGGLLLIAAYSHTMDRFIPIAARASSARSWSRPRPGRTAIELVYLALAIAAVAR